MSPSAPSRYGSLGPPKLDRRGRIRLAGGVAGLILLLAVAAWASRLGAGPAATVYGNATSTTATTWTWDGNDFTAQPKAGSGPSSNQSEMAFDRRAGVVVLWDHGCSRLVMGFTGGCDTRVDRTWTWDGRAWLAQRTSRSPKAVGQGAMFYDARLGGVVYLNRAGQAWTWGGSDWRSVAIGGGPRLTPPGSVANSEQLLVAAGYDEGRDLLVLALPNKTWTWDGSRWGQAGGGIDLADGQSDPRAVFDDARRELVYLGTKFVWSWDGTRWRSQPRPGLAGGSLGYDPLRKNLVVVQQDTAACSKVSCAAKVWRWDGTGWSRLSVGHEPALPLTRSGLEDLPLAFDESRGVLVLVVSAA